MTNDLLKDTAQRASRFLDTLATRDVFPSPEVLEALSAFDEDLPDNPTDPSAVIQMLDAIGSPAAVASAGGRYFGFVTGGSLPATLAANWLSTTWDQNGGLNVGAPVGGKLEEVALKWLIDVLDFPAETGVGFVTGATMANFSGLAAARHTLLAKQGWNVEADGLFGAPPITVVVGNEVHVSLLKALMMLGLGRERVIRVPADEQGRMRADQLPELDSNTIVCIQAGNVNTGAFDPAEAIITKAHAAGAWVHVDGAFGLWAAASPSKKHLMAGFNQADSMATDGHKWLNVPYDCGLVFVRDVQTLTRSMSATASYLVQSDHREPEFSTPEMSRRARGIEVWAALRSLGRSGLADLIDRNCRMAQDFAAGFRAAGYEVLNDVVLNQVLVAFGDRETTLRVIESIQKDGTTWCGSTVWHERTAMRISVSSWATTDADIQESLSAMVRIADGITK
jgi:glutamate/tyrosine decarboxylase-like PLP-dependent enzyme